jgi:translation initiation factor IF-3
MKYRPKIGHGDFDTKTRKVEEFLGEGHKVKVTIMFRGREMQHPELGRKILNQVADAVVHVGAVEVYPKQDGRNMIMVLGPDKKAQIQIKKPRPDASTAPLPAPDTTPAASADVAPASAPAPVAEASAPPASVATPQDAS